MLDLRIKPNGNTIYAPKKSGSTSGVVAQRVSKTEEVSNFLKDLHSQVIEQMLQGEMDAHLGYKKDNEAGNNTGN